MSINELKERISEWLRGDYSASIFCRDEFTIGYALYRQEADWTYVRQFFILPQFRRQGLGRKAIQMLIDENLARTGRIRLDVLVDNERGLAFWREMGFRDYCITMEFEDDS